MKKVYAVLDTNVLVSALLKPASVPGKVLQHALVGQIIPLYDRRIIEEYRKVLHRDKFHFDIKLVDELLEEYQKCGICVEATPSNEKFEDKDDIIFYEVALEMQNENAMLVTGNIKHFPPRLYIVTPKEMLHILEVL